MAARGHYGNNDPFLSLRCLRSGRIIEIATTLIRCLKREAGFEAEANLADNHRNTVQT